MDKLKELFDSLPVAFQKWSIQLSVAIVGFNTLWLTALASGYEFPSWVILIGNMVFGVAQMVVSKMPQRNVSEYNPNTQVVVQKEDINADLTAGS